MATNEPLNSAADEVAAAEAELKAAQEKLEAAKAKLAATTSDDACDVEKETVAAVVVDEATGEVEAVVVEDVAVVSCDAGSEDKEEAPSDASTDASTEDASEASAAAPSAAPAEPAKAAEPEPEWVPYSTAQAIPPTAAPQATPAQPQPQAPAAASASTASYTQPAGAPPAPGQPASGYYAPPGYGAPQTPPHAGPGAVPPQQPYYGYQQPYYQQPYSQPMVTTKDHVAAGLLAIFLGAFGIHKFYLGYNTAGFIMLAVTIIGGVLTFSLAHCANLRARARAPREAQVASLLRGQPASPLCALRAHRRVASLPPGSRSARTDVSRETSGFSLRALSVGCRLFAVAPPPPTVRPRFARIGGSFAGFFGETARPASLFR